MDKSDSLILGVLLVAAKISFLPWSPRNSTTNQIKDEEQLTIVDDELDQFMNLAYAVWNGEQHLTGGWKEHSARIRFLMLSKMAIDIFSIPPMSAEPERTFFSAKHTISSETLELLECMKS